MREALWIVRQFPSQIRRDLHRFHGLKLADWWRGTRDTAGHLVLSSSELLDYLRYLDEESAFKADAERGGRWPDWKQMLAEGTNEGYRFRASYHATHSSEEHDVRFDPSELEFVDPAVRKLRDEEERREAEQHSQTDPELADAGWM